MPDIHVIFRATNHHAASCGTPPCVDEPPDGSNVFRSYFENRFGEQWILTHDAATDLIKVYSGDCGWESELVFFEAANSLGSLQAPIVCGKNGPIMLGKDEQKWIAACLDVIEARRELAPPRKD